MISGRFRTKTEGSADGPLFFIGCPSPAKATHFDRCMVSINSLRKRQSDFKVNEWLLDSGAFSELSRFRCYRHSTEQYAAEIRRWSACGKLLAAVSQDYMCESFILKRTGLSVAEHQRLTIERYDALIRLVQVPVLPVLQGYRVNDYLSHLDQYGTRLGLGAWVGVGSVCKRNSRPGEIADILASIKNKRPDLRLHGFGLKLTTLESREVCELLHSCDSMAWSYPSRFGKGDDSIETADTYIEQVEQALADCAHKRSPVTAGSGNGQGRKASWIHTPTKAIRVPAAFADDLIDLAKQWDAPAVDFVQKRGDTYNAEIGHYAGGKGQDGTFQKIINEMPPHNIYIEAFLGGGAVMRHKRPARVSYGIEIDPEVIEKWRGVEIPGLRLRRTDAIRFLAEFPWSGSELVYCDPTYLRETRSSQDDIYRYEMTTDEHRELLGVIKRIPAPVIISGYWSPLYAEALAGWRAVSFTAIKRSGEKAEEWL